MDNIEFGNCTKCGRYLVKGDECHCDQPFVPSKEYLKEHKEIMKEIQEIEKDTRFPE